MRRAGSTMRLRLTLMAWLAAAVAQSEERTPRTLEEFLRADQAIIRHATTVTAFRIARKGTTRFVGAHAPRVEMLDGHQLFETRVLPSKLAEKARAAVLDRATWHFTDCGENCGEFKLCGGFNPAIAFRFDDGKTSRDVLVCFLCDDLEIGDPAHFDGTARMADVGPGHDRLLSLALDVFPDDVALAWVRRRDEERKALPPGVR